ncbi:TetR/AcrR family transcriptional regulator C-terminal domain-containing protein [Streptomyces sp. P5-A9]|uniref:TetR/AcrR family transcriptional regulator C-terminal domain-containing protein n=1 Tax=Streptomyces sp. P5-A9 TaxID=3071730 RepID=UPI003FCE1C1D
MVAGAYPHLAAILPTLTSADFTAHFEFGLRLPWTDCVLADGECRRRHLTSLTTHVRFPRDAGMGDRGSDGSHERSPDDACAEEVPAGVA